MTEAKTKSVNMTFPALFSYVMNTNYRSMSGILGLVLSFGAIVMLVIGWNTTSGRQKAIFIIVALMFTVINPLSLAFKTFKQLKTSPSYKQPLVYTFGDNGIGVSQTVLNPYFLFLYLLPIGVISCFTVILLNQPSMCLYMCPPLDSPALSAVEAYLNAPEMMFPAV